MANSIIAITPTAIAEFSATVLEQPNKNRRKRSSFYYNNEVGNLESRLQGASELRKVIATFIVTQSTLQLDSVVLQTRLN